MFMPHAFHMTIQHCHLIKSGVVSPSKSRAARLQAMALSGQRRK
jgi:hypothetical protein